MRLQERAWLPGPRERVWAVLSDWEGQANWMPDVALIRVVGRERQLGARLVVKTKVFGLPFATDLVKVTSWEPPHLLAVEHAGVVLGRGEWRLESAEEGTMFTWTESFRLRSTPSWLGEPALALYGPVQRRMLKRSISNLARLVDAG